MDDQIASAKSGTGVRGRTKRWHKRREEIIAVAQTIFAAQGYKATRLDYVAEAMNMQRPSLHYYFTGKDDLYDAVVTKIVTETLQRFKNLEESDNTQQQLERITTTWLDYAVSSPDAARILLAQFIEPDLPPTNSARKPRQQTVRIVQKALNAAFKEKKSAKMDPILLILVQSGVSLLWVCMSENMQKRLGYDTLSKPHLDSFRQLLKHLFRDFTAGG